MRDYVYVALLVATLVYVFWRGGRSERQAAGMLLAAVVLTGLLVPSGPFRFRAPEYGIFAADLAYYLGMLTLATLTQRAFALWISAIIGAQLLLHVARMLALQVDYWVYANSVTLWSYPKLAILITTTARQNIKGSAMEGRSLSSFLRSSIGNRLKRGRTGS